MAQRVLRHLHGEQKLIASWKPEWNTRVDDQGNRTYAMWLDRLATARRIDQPILDKSDIANAFDGITYQKGASVLNMAENAMGEERFRLAVRSYLEHHARANATAQDFLDALGEAAGPSAPASFRTFLEQPGVPEVSMQLKCESGKARIDLQQRRFVPLGGSTSDGQSWKVPVCVSYGMPDGLRSKCTTLDERTAALALETSSCPAFFYGNAKAKGYYYTRYEAPALRALVQNRSQLSLAERAGLFGELDNLAKTGVLPVSEGLKLAVDLKDDAARQVTEAALQFANIRLEFLPRELRPRYAAYVRDTFGARARALGWTPKPGESDEDRLLRPSIVGFVAGDGEDKELIAQATALAAKWLDSRQALPAETFGEIFRIAARNGDAALHERIVAAAKAEKDEFFEGRLIGALGEFRSPSLVQRNFDLLLQGTFDMRHAYGLVFGPLNDPDLARLPLEFVMARYDALVARLPSGVGSDYAAYLPQTAGRGCSAEAAREAEAFFKPRMANVSGGPRNLAQTLEAIRLCEARKATQQADLTQFFQSR